MWREPIRSGVLSHQPEKAAESSVDRGCDIVTHASALAALDRPGNECLAYSLHTELTSMAALFEASSDNVTSTKPTAIAPSPRMLQAALSGLMVAGAFGCSDSDKSALSESSTEELSNEQLRAMCADMVADAKKEAEDKAAENQAEPDLDALCEGKVKDAQSACEKPDTDELCKDAVTTAVGEAQKDTTKLCEAPVKEAVAKATAVKTPDEKMTNSEQKEYTFADLTKTCDSRGGYVQVHAACGGVNACQGFSYGDWGPGAATLTEHSCTGVNGCAGLSCVVLPEEKNKDKSGAELYDLLFADTEPNSCSGCHADHSGDEPDLTKFAVYLLEGSTRTAANWLDRTAADQERVVAFGAHSVLPDGTAMANMAAYSKVLSRKEIEKVVAHLRTLTPMIKTIKTKDQQTATPGEH
jgi:hypothetical protein